MAAVRVAPAVQAAMSPAATTEDSDGVPPCNAAIGGSDDESGVDALRLAFVVAVGTAGGNMTASSDAVHAVAAVMTAASHAIQRTEPRA